MSASKQSAHIETSTLGEEGELRLSCSNLGASILTLQVPYKDGFLDVVTGYPDFRDYVDDPYYMGAMCGRYAGRIANGAFRLNGKKFTLATQEAGAHALHGGTHGFNTRLWERLDTHRSNQLRYSLYSPDNDQGFPGNLTATVTYSIERKTHLTVDVEAICDQDTVVNLVSHAYFNLNAGSGLIDNHRVTIVADERTALESDGIPSGDIVPVANTRFDLRTDRPALLGKASFDQNFVLSKVSGELELAAMVSVDDHPVCLGVHTTLPGLQFYTGDQLGGVFRPREGLCLEAQQFPDAPNQPHFPATTLRAGERYHSRTVYAFGPASDVRKL